MPILCKASEQHIQPDVPSSSMVPSGAAPYETGAFCAAARCGIPACPRVPVPSFPLTARALPSPRPLFSPLSEPAHQALAAAVRELARTCPPSRKGRQRRHRPLPAKNRNFLDLWQTIAQDLSRLFAVPGCCPPCSGSPKGWPGLCHRHALATGQGQPLCCFRRPRARCRSLPESASRCLAGRRCPRRHGHDDTAGTHALPACSPSTAPGDRSGMAARGAATQSHGPE